MAAPRINLLPPELARRRRSRQIVSMMIVAVAGLLVLFAIVYIIQVLRLGGVERELDQHQRRNTALRLQVSRLNEFDDLERELDRKTELLSQLTRDEVRWSVVLADISLVIPSDVWLTGFQANIGAGGAEEGAEGGDDDDAEPSLGQIQLNGTTFAHTDVARWLARLGNVEAFASPYLSLSTKGVVGTTPVVTFNSTVQLSEGAFRRNQPGARRAL